MFTLYRLHTWYCWCWAGWWTNGLVHCFFVTLWTHAIKGYTCIESTTRATQQWHALSCLWSGFGISTRTSTIHCWRSVIVKRHLSHSKYRSKMNHLLSVTWKWHPQLCGIFSFDSFKSATIVRGPPRLACHCQQDFRSWLSVSFCDKVQHNTTSLLLHLIC